jgi:hypothetical protein
VGRESVIQNAEFKCRIQNLELRIQKAKFGDDSPDPDAESFGLPAEF